MYSHNTRKQRTKTMSLLMDWINKNTITNQYALTYRRPESNNYTSVTYMQLRNHIVSLSSYLSKYKNKTIAIIGNNKLEYVVSLLSILCNIGNAFLIDKEIKQEEIDDLFGVVKPDLVIVDDKINLSIKSIDTITFSQINKAINEEYEFTSDASFSGKLILHTSGTTGKPKCIELTEEMYTYIIKDLNDSWQVQSHHSCLFIIPLYHVYALVSLFHGLYAGTQNIIEWDYAQLENVLKETHPSIFLGVPLVFNKIKDATFKKAGNKLKFGLSLSNFLMKFGIDARKKIFKDLHAYFGNNYYFSVSGGSLANPETNKFFDDVGLPVYNGYGMTETTGPVTINYQDNNRYDSVGKILNNDVKIINADSNGIGEILIAGPNVIKQYINSEKDDCFVDGYFNTGDLGYIKDDFLYITGRKKEVLIGDNGKNVSTVELSNKILQNDLINDCTLKMEDNKIIAILDTDLSEQEVQRYINEINTSLPNYKKIFSFKIIDKGFIE